ncbi:MAG: hypothetical protein AAFR75_05235 [Pseudomonadota bacterium]
MFFHLVAVAVIGVTAALVVYIFKNQYPRSFPGYVYPIAIGASMLVYNVWAEYSWFSRTASALPAHIKVIRSYDVHSPIQPWTYLIPYKNRFAAVDLSTKRENPKTPGYAIASLILAKRFEPTIELKQIIDCNGKRSAEIDTTTKFGENGLPTNSVWSDEADLKPMIEAVCTM